MTMFSPLAPVLGGHRSGPILAVEAPPAILRELADRLARIPSLSRMRGALVLGAARPMNVDARLRFGDGEASLRDLHWQVLAAATQLGMISGRGVPGRFLDAVYPLAFPLAPTQRCH
ncbi:hypothetical protein [Gymnodinialimonas ulvae]|uniref:hypothetical protein n=1 Tax=Gymnodinialimonas ulvae TaxID=3126504 RepID=UPI0030ADA307